MKKWKESQASATLENSLEGMLNDLKQQVLDSRINKNTLTPEQFEKTVQNLAKETRVLIIDKFFKNTED